MTGNRFLPPIWTEAAAAEAENGAKRLRAHFPDWPQAQAEADELEDVARQLREAGA